LEKKGFWLKRKEIGTGSRKLLCFGIEDVDERKLYNTEGGEKHVLIWGQHLDSLML
jgi:hypothetical protein